jgi:hypothetical protein
LKGWNAKLVERAADGADARGRRAGRGVAVLSRGPRR